MTRRLITLLLILSAPVAYAQQISNIRVTQESDKVIILYDLTARPGQAYDIEVSVSSDNGKSYPIKPKTITGDLINVLPGNDKKLTWDVLKDTEQLNGAGFVFKLQVKNLFDFDIEMVFVEGGTFRMGSTNGDSDEQPVHSVTLSNFYIGKTEVTQAQWVAVMGSNPSGFRGDNLPVEQVSWDDVQNFITKLNILTSSNYRLPTEAEWAYAARGGKNSNGYIYSGSNTIGDVAWYSGNSGSTTHPVGTKAANELGLFDMSGNVWEWCADWYGAYSSPAQTNPTGPATGSGRVEHGGSWLSNSSICRVASRDYCGPDLSSTILGFRLAHSSGY